MSSGEAERVRAGDGIREMKRPELPLETTATFVCNIGAMTAEQRQRYQALTKQLQSSTLEIKELTNGFGFRIQSADTTVEDVAEWITYEKLCCPFFDFAFEVEPEGGAMWLRLTGPAGVKPFIKSEFDI